MASKNDGLGMGPEFWTPLPGQDRKHFPLGTSKAVPASGYFADVAGLANEQLIKDQIAGLSSAQEIEDALFKVFSHNRYMARDFMKWRLGMKNAQRP
jgi:hypothetical protein